MEKMNNKTVNEFSFQTKYNNQEVILINKIKQLKDEFNKISKKGYIKGIYNSHSSIGRTFENELNLTRNEFCYPDYNGIEIKTRRTYSKSPITLFSAVPDGKELFEVKRLKSEYGYPYKKDKRYKVLYFEAYGNKKTFGGIKYQYKLDIDKKQQKIFLCIYNIHNILVERKVYWSFDYLERKIMTKLQMLAIVNVWDKKIEGWNYFRYYKINFYIIKNFETFLNLLDIGIIKLDFKVDIYKDKQNYGKTYDHGCSFRIQEQDITKLYDIIEV